MRVEQRNVYTFEELSPEIQQKVIEKNYDVNVDYEWWEDNYLLDPTDPELKEMKVRLPEDYKSPIFSWKKIYFDIDRNSHLEFVNLEVNDTNAFRLLLGLDKRLFDKAWLTFDTDNFKRYPTTILTYEPNDPDRGFTEQEIKLLDRAVERFNDMIYNALKRLRKQYEFCTSEESIKDTIIGNSWEFTETGEMV
jgi:hypothetical protein